MNEMPGESLFQKTGLIRNITCGTIVFLLKLVWLFALQGTRRCAKRNRNDEDR